MGGGSEQELCSAGVGGEGGGERYMAVRGGHRDVGVAYMSISQVLAADAEPLYT